MMPSSAQLLNRDVIFIFKLFKLKAKGDDNVPIKGLDFIMKAGGIGIAVHEPDNYALFAVELIAGGPEPYQISYLHHAYSIAHQGLRVKGCIYMWNWMAAGVSAERGGHPFVRLRISDWKENRLA